MNTLAERLHRAASLLEPITETPRLDAEILLAHALDLTRARLLARLNETCPAERFEALLARRLAHEPLAYILGEWEFFSLAFHVEAPMLVPRPETEHLVEAVLEFAGSAPARILDIGTGTGCVAVSVLCNAAAVQVTATDIRPEPLALARRNAERHGAADRLRLMQGDLFAALPENEEPFDVICSNPPYVEENAWEDLDPVIRLHEDRGALLAGPDGLDVIRRLIREAVAWLKPHGWLAFELGMGQYVPVRRLLEQHGYSQIQFRKDLAGIERVAAAQRGA